MPVIISLLLTVTTAACCQGATSKIEGDWEIIEYREQGKNEPESGGVGKIYRFTEQTITSIREKQGETYRCRMDPRKSQLDWFVKVGEQELCMKSVYSITGDLLTINRTFSGEPRPTTLKSVKGERGGVFVLRRVRR